jgi:hypothetical protein
MDGQSLRRSSDTGGGSGREICQTEVQRGVQAHGTQGGDTLLAGAIGAVEERMGEGHPLGSRIDDRQAHRPAWSRSTVFILR